MKKNELLIPVLQVMATNVKMQRLCTEFQQQLKMLTEFWIFNYERRKVNSTSSLFYKQIGLGFQQKKKEKRKIEKKTCFFLCFAIWSARSCWTMAINIARCSVCPQVNTGDLIFLILTNVLSLLFLCPEKGGKGIYIKNAQVLLLPLVTYVSIKSVAHIRPLE